MELIPKLATALSDADTELLRVIRKNLENSSISEIIAVRVPHLSLILFHQSINTVINEDCQHSKSSYHMRIQECFAVRVSNFSRCHILNVFQQPGINGLLDVARKTVRNHQMLNLTHI